MSRKRGHATACRDKKSFSTMAGAQDAMMSLVRRKPVRGFLQAYKCRHCPGYHFGHVSGGAEHRQGRLIDRIDRAIARDAARAVN